jgi:hypothetical protein
MAGAKGLEPSTSAVTGQRSNQLSYAPAGAKPNLSDGLKARPPASQEYGGKALRATTSAVFANLLVGGDGLEPPTTSV